MKEIFSIAIFVFSFSFVRSQSEPILSDCKGDGFQSVMYRDSHGERFLKYLFVEDEELDNYYNFPQASERCQNLNATLWEIADGQVEWETLISITKKWDKEMWINAEVKGSCPGDREFCLEAEAEQGEGLTVIWPSFPNTNYSRLYKPATPSNKCIIVDAKHPKLLWKTTNCEAITAAAICVKRDCEVE